MPSPSGKEEADRNAWQVRAAASGCKERESEAASAYRSPVSGWYTIEYLTDEHGARPVVSPMLFRDRETALASAVALLQAGFDVLRVAGPDLEISGMALVAYLVSRLSK